MGIKIHNHYITDGYELSRKEVLKMIVKVRKKPVRKAERAIMAQKTFSIPCVPYAVIAYFNQIGLNIKYHNR